VSGWTRRRAALQRWDAARAEEASGNRYWPDGAPWGGNSAGLGADVAEHERGEPDHPYGAPDCAEPDPETAHFGSASPEAQDRGHWPLPRVLEPGEVSPVRTPVAAALPDGTPHPAPYLAGRGWQAQSGIYTAAAQLQAEAG
jgi:hypothetical protein